MAAPPVRLRVHHDARLDHDAWRLHRATCDLAPDHAEFLPLEAVITADRAPEACRRCYPDTTLLLGGTWG